MVIVSVRWSHARRSRASVGGRRRLAGELADGCQLEFRDRLRAEPSVRVVDGWAVVAAKLPDGASVERADLAERLDRRCPRPAVVSVAILDRHGDPGRLRDARAGPRSGQDADAAQRLGTALRAEPARRSLHQRRVDPVMTATDELRV